MTNVNLMQAADLKEPKPTGTVNKDVAVTATPMPILEESEPWAAYRSR
jgi:hypothetical protein